MTRFSAKALGLLCVIASLGILVRPEHKAAGQESQTQVYPDVWNEIAHDTSPPLKLVGKAAANNGPKHTINWLKREHKATSSTPDPVVQTGAGPLLGTTGLLNFSGVSANGSAPPDTSGAVGATQYVQWVNTEFAIFDKSTGALVQGPVAGNSLWSGFADAQCASSNDGDIIAQYDKSAGRWVMAQPVFSSPYEYCIAVSTTSDATGTYNRYSFSMPSFPDYPKLGIWPDAYYGSFNLFQGNSFVGAYSCAFNRSAMLAGTAATGQCFTTPSEFSFLPSDLDGSTQPPAGSPAYYVDLGTLSSLNLYRFHVDFANPANSTFTGPSVISVASYNEACGGGTCIPQPGTSNVLDSLGDRLMYRLAYRNFGDHEALVTSHSVNAGSTVGVRWYEIRSPSSSPAVFQEGTYSPDSTYRWMPSIAMDKSGDIAVGYSASSSALHPSIRYSGRVPTDAAGTLETENSILTGNFSQTGNLNRWGDYSSMSVDPADDCTFFYTNEYLPSNGSFNWATQIASFKFSGCGGAPTPDFSLSASPTSRTVSQGSGTSYGISVNPINGFNGSVTFTTTGSLPSGVSANFSPNPSTTSTTMSVTTSSTTPAGTYTITVNGASGGLNHTVSVTLVVQAVVVGDFSISASPSSRSVRRGQSTTFSVTVTGSGGFNGTVSLSASGLPSRTTATFNPSSFTGSGTSTLTVSSNKHSPAGTKTLTITGTSGSLSHSANVTLTLQ